ncbi:MAG: hypothetical protein ACTSXD_01050 [Candidatus Heimdallarchaeaceae archaeon]
MLTIEESLLSLGFELRFIVAVVVFCMGFVVSYIDKPKNDPDSDITHILLLYTFAIMSVLILLFPNHVLDFVTEYLAGILGVYTGFTLERRNEKNREKKEKEIADREYQEKLDRMSAYIYMELAENYYYFSPSGSRNDFVTNYWEVFQNDLGNWKGKELVKIIRIYNLMEKFGSPSNSTNWDNNELQRLIASVLNWFQDKVDSDELFKEKILAVKEEFKEMQDLFDKPIPNGFSIKYFPRRRN